MQGGGLANWQFRNITQNCDLLVLSGTFKSYIDVTYDVTDDVMSNSLINGKVTVVHIFVKSYIQRSVNA